MGTREFVLWYCNACTFFGAHISLVFIKMHSFIIVLLVVDFMLTELILYSALYGQMVITTCRLSIYVVQEPVENIVLVI